MFGKIFAAMYEGSLVGKGAVVFAVMGYAIARAYPVKDRMQVTLNPHLIATAIGEPVKDVQKAITMLCSPDPETTTPDQGGRRLVKIGSFEYWLVNGMKYRAIRDEETRREQNRTNQANFRMRKRGIPLAGEIKNQQMQESGATEGEVIRHFNSFNRDEEGPL